MKRIIIAFCSVMLISLSLTFAGCGTVQPYEIEWHLSAYCIDGEYYDHCVGFNYYNHFDSVFSDCARISFNDDGSFYFKDREGVQYNGTYKSKKGRYDTEVTLTFPDGSEAEGSYSKYDFADYTYEALFEIFGVKYYFNDKERDFDADDLETCLTNVAGAICTFAADGKMSIAHYPYYENLKKAVIGKVSGSYVAVTGNNVYLLDSANYWCYSVDSEKIKSCELKEGECIIRTGYESFAVYYPVTNEQ